MISSQNIDQRCTSTKFKKKCWIESLIFSYEEKYTYEYTKRNKVYVTVVTVLLFILYSIWVHVESPKYKMICLKSPKSSEFAKKINKQWSKILNYVYFIMLKQLFHWIFKNREIKKKLRLRRDSNPQPLGFRLRNTCAKKTAANFFNKENYHVNCFM